MLVVHNRKNSHQKGEDNSINFSKKDYKYNLNTKNGRKNYSLNKRTNSPGDKNQKYALKTIRLKSPQIDYEETKYNSITYKHFHNANSQKNFEDNKIKKKKDGIVPKIKESLKNQNNLSDINIQNNKTIDKPFSLYNNLKNLQNNKKNPISINISSDNINKSNYSIDEELTNQKYQNHQTKSTKILKMKVLQKDKSQEELKKRLFLNSIEPIPRNHNSIYFTQKSKYVYSEDNEEGKKNYNNHKLYEFSETRKNNHSKGKNKSSSSINNSYITQNKKTTISIIKDKGKEKKKETEKEKEKEKPKPRLTPTPTPKQRNKNNSELNEDVAVDINKEKTIIKTKIIDITPEDIGQKKDPIFLSPEIFAGYHPKFKQSIYNSDNEFNKNDIIKAYAYNTNEGNIRDYNEDTITATKIILDPKDKTNYFYYFAVYDGHGGNGCSIYLKNNLYKNIKEPSVKGIKNAISETENNFLEKVAVVNGTLVDMSGSCGIMVIIKNRKCIIANIGDSRCVLFKNKRVCFSTRDHKPNSAFEKRRIELAGGTVYQTESIIPLFQNGKQIEIPWRVMPGGLSVSRTFGDIESKEAKFGGKKDVVAALPDVVEFELNDDYNFMVIGCDGIFDVLSNNEMLECIKIVLKINKNKKKINELCGDFAAMIIKSALAKESFDNVSCIVVVFNINGLI